VGKSCKNKRIAQRLALYIHLMGVQPDPFHHKSYRAYLLVLQEQYAILKQSLDPGDVEGAC